MVSDPRVLEHRCWTRTELTAKSFPSPRPMVSSFAAPNSCHGLDVVEAAGCIQKSDHISETGHLSQHSRFRERKSK